ncbi:MULTISPECIES: hypothetical protein [unclassified Paraburkholderia]|uniref:hypothetical protein n=1 Tax=unclassified Paraburkholderia TaxID=2615204 RepID=UPI002AB2847F|nr:MULTISPECIES: hypothetical protein [unclassified Paraburkholderia]
MPHEYPAIAQDDDDALTYTGPYPVNQQHKLDSLLEKALKEFESAAQYIAVSYIQDSSTRKEYLRQIGEIPKMVREEISAGHVGVEEGVRFAQMMRNQIMKETRAATSATGLAVAERYKKDGLTKRFLLERYSCMQNVEGFTKLKQAEQKAYVNEIVAGTRQSVYDTLTAEQRAKVFYGIIDASGRDSVQMTTKVRRWAVRGKVFLLMTSVLAIYSVATATDKVAEVNRQGAIIGGSLLGGVLADAAVASLCGPGAPVCAYALVVLGSMAGAIAAGSANDLYQEELQEYMKWQIR